MFRERQQEILSNKQICYKLHTNKTIYVQKRGHVPYDDKRIPLANLPNGKQNVDTHAFIHYSFEKVQMPELKQPPACEEIIVVVWPSLNKQYEAKLAQKHARIVKKTRAHWPDTGEDGDSIAELHCN